MPKSWSFALTSASFCFRSTGPAHGQYKCRQAEAAGDIRLTALPLDMSGDVVKHCVWVSRGVSNKQALKQWEEEVSGVWLGYWVLGI